MRLATLVEPLGVFLIAECDLRLSARTAPTPGSVTAVRGGGDQFVACRSCLERMVGEDEWEIPNARIRANVDVLLTDAVGLPAIAMMLKDTPRTGAVKVEDWAMGIVQNLAPPARSPRRNTSCSSSCRTSASYGRAPRRSSGPRRITSCPLSQLKFEDRGLSIGRTHASVRQGDAA